MDNVFGPYTEDEWYTLKYLKSSMSWFKAQPNIQKYRVAIQKEQALFEEYAYK